MRPLIFISNDDSVYAQGLEALIEMLRPMADLFVVAPDRPRSGAACSLTAEVPIHATLHRVESGLTVYACSGTPTDCAKLAFDQLLPRQPDLVVSGINHGSNASINAHYSGTVGVAIEGAIHGLPSAAFSLCDHRPDADFEPLVPYVQAIVSKMQTEELPFGTCLNVNFPPIDRFLGVRICRMAYARWQEEFTPDDIRPARRYYWLGGECVNDEPEESDTDLWAIQNGYVAITPVRVDVTDTQAILMINSWNL